MSSSKNKVCASLASIKERSEHLHLTINSLINQVDNIFVFLNGYDDTPDVLKNKKITIFRSQEIRDFGDAGKFYAANLIPGYYLSCDDDIIYPNNYVKNIINSINTYNKKAVIGYHGVTIDNKSFKDYFSSRKVDHFNQELKKDKYVHILGTGVMGFYNGNIKINIEDFPIKNMADIWMGIKSQKNKIPMICAKHDKDTFVTTKSAGINSIYRNSRESTGNAQDSKEAQDKNIIKYIPWKINR